MGLGGLLSSLPAPLRDTLRAIYGDSLIQALQADSAAALAFFLREGDQIRKLSEGLLSGNALPYRDGDSLWYLSGPANLSAHFIAAKSGDDVAGVLISRRFDSTGRWPQNTFQQAFGVTEKKFFYRRGDVQSLGAYSNIPLPNGRMFFDSIPVFNVSFIGGWNRLFFYGVEKAYDDFIETAVYNGDDPRVKTAHNIEGGRGVFAGAVLDSFRVYIRVDSSVLSFPQQEARLEYCRDESWRGPECRSFYMDYCADSGYSDVDCNLAAMKTCLTVGWNGGAGGCDSSARVTIANAEMTSGVLRQRARNAIERAERELCVASAFTAELLYPDSVATCAAADSAAYQAQGVNATKEALWEYCKEADWRPTHCRPAMAIYCRDKGRPSQMLCRQADAWCRDNPNHRACR